MVGGAAAATVEVEEPRAGEEEGKSSGKDAISTAAAFGYPSCRPCSCRPPATLSTRRLLPGSLPPPAKERAATISVVAPSPIASEAPGASWEEASIAALKVTVESRLGLELRPVLPVR